VPIDAVKAHILIVRSTQDAEDRGDGAIREYYQKLGIWRASV
jgi:hypothetical protein